MNNMAQVKKINERELELGISGDASWHAKYKDSAWVYVGGLSTSLSEGDIICVLSQWGEVEDFNYPRDAKTGAPRGWCWCKYEDQRSSILAVDNGNGASVLGRTLRVDHCEKYKLPPEVRDREEKKAAAGAEGQYGPSDGDERSKFAPGAAYVGKELASAETLDRGVDVFAAGAPTARERAAADGWRAVDPRAAVIREKKAKKKEKKEKKAKKKDKKNKSRRGPPSEEDDAPLLGYVAEALPAPSAPPLTGEARQGEVVAASWRGAREPGAASTYSSRAAYGSFGTKKFVGKPEKKRTWDEVERDRNKSYAGMKRLR